MVAQAQTPDLGTLAKTKGASIKYVAIGSSLSAGVRNGGVYAAAQQTSFPALLAQQMGITDFKQPLLEGNGTGNKSVSVDKNGILKFTETKDFDDTKKDATLPKVIGEVDNLAVPYLKASYLGIAENSSGAFLPNFDVRAYKHQNRVSDATASKTESYVNLIQKKIKNVDFFTFELGFDDFMSYYTNGGYGQSISFMTYDREGYFPEAYIISQLTNKGAKGVISNIPDINKLPVYNLYSAKLLVEKIGRENAILQRYEKSGYRIVDSRDLLIPTERLSKVISGVDLKAISAESPILDEEIIGYEEQVSVDLYNLSIAQIAQQNKIPVVDLKGLYDKIIGGNHISDDGIKIDPSYPKGNFFSADGLSPTAFGQAIITNEFIKTINKFYQSNIPLLVTKSFLNL